MPTTIKLKNSVTTTNAPSSLAQGEVAINITDKKVWVGNAATTPIQLLGDGGSASFTSIAFGAGTVSLPSITFIGDTNTGIYSPAADTIAFTEGGAESMRIDSSGRVAIGTTTTTDAGLTITTGVTRDSSWSAKLALQSTGGNDFPVLLFSGCSATNRYGAIVQTASTSGNTPSQITAAIQFENSSSTAGNILFATNGNVGTSTSTERMRITSTGSVGIGNSIPASFNAFANQLVVGNGSSSQGITLYASGSSSISFADGTTGSQSYEGYIQYNHAVDAMDFIVNYTGNPSPRMRIDSSGNVGIGTSAPSGIGKLAVKTSSTSSGAGLAVISSADDSFLTIYNASSVHNIGATYSSTGSYQPIAFLTSNLERVRITTGGNVCINTTTAGSRLTIDVNAQNYTDGIDISNSAFWGYGSSINFRALPTSGGSLDTVARIQQFYEASNQYGLSFSTYNAGLSERMRITSGGEVYIAGTTDQGAYNLQCNGTGVWGAGAYVNGSDERIKDKIAPLDSGLDVVAKLNPVTYKYKKDWSKDQSTQTGFIAQELLTALEGKNYVDGVVQQGGEYMSVAYQNIIPILTKAIQEQQAMIEELKQEVALLKSK